MKRSASEMQYEEEAIDDGDDVMADGAEDGGVDDQDLGLDADEMEGVSLEPVQTDSGDAEIVNVDFEFKDPEPIDEISTYRMLNRDRSVWKPFEPREMGKLINAQVAVGTTIKVEGDTDVYAFATALSTRVLGATAGSPVRMVLDHVLKHAPDAATRKKLEQAFTAEALPTVGFVVVLSLCTARRAQSLQFLRDSHCPSAHLPTHHALTKPLVRNNLLYNQGPPFQ